MIKLIWKIGLLRYLQIELKLHVIRNTEDAFSSGIYAHQWRFWFKRIGWVKYYATPELNEKHLTDKRYVLFWGGPKLLQEFMEGASK